MRSKINMVTPNIKERYEEQQKHRMGKLEKLIEEVKQTVVYVNDYKYKDYMVLVDEYYDIIKEGFEYDWFRHATIPVRFEKGGDITALKFTHFVTHSIMWSLLRRLDVDIEEKHVFDAHQINQHLIKGFIDEHVIEIYRHQVSNHRLNKYIHDMMFKLSRIPRDFNDIMSITMSIETFIDIIDRHPRVGEIVQTRIGEEMQPSEIENLLDGLTREQLDIIANDDQYNDLKPLIRSGQGIRPDQFKEFAVNGGLKPDLDGNTIPIVVDTNLITDGLNKITYYYIDAKGGRKSLIMNSTSMGRSGHFARLLMLLCSDYKLSDEVDCGTLHTASIPIKGQYNLDRLRGRSYRLPYHNSFSTLSPKDTHLIGETIRLRTPSLCATMPYICDTCCGDIVITNRELNSIGGLAATSHSEPLSQKILSAKHLLATISENINFVNPRFDECLTLVSNEIMINKDMDEGGYDLMIKKTDIRKLEDEDAGDIGRYVYRFFVRDNKGEMLEFTEHKEKELLISPDLEETIKSMSKRRGRRRKVKGNEGYIVIPFDEIEYSDRLFLIEILNNELTKPLTEIMGLIDRAEIRRQKDVWDVDAMISVMMDLLEESDIGAHSVYSEIIIAALIRSKDDPYHLERPNLWRYDGVNDIHIMTMRQALTNNPSITVSLAYQEIRKQLLRPSTYMKSGKSFLDPLFQKQLDKTSD